MFWEKDENKQTETGFGPYIKKKQKDRGGNSVTRLGDFLHFGQQFKAFGNNKFAQISYILSQFL